MARGYEWTRRGIIAIIWMRWSFQGKQRAYKFLEFGSGRREYKQQLTKTKWKKDTKNVIQSLFLVPLSSFVKYPWIK